MHWWVYVVLAYAVSIFTIGRKISTAAWCFWENGTFNPLSPISWFLFPLHTWSQLNNPQTRRSLPYKKSFYVTVTSFWWLPRTLWGAICILFVSRMILLLKSTVQASRTD
jgi:hypothetical protein